MASRKLITIDDENWRRYRSFMGGIGSDGPSIRGERKAKGLIIRDFGQYPQGYLGPVARPFDLPLIPISEIPDRIAEQERNQSSLQHIRDQADNGRPIPSYDQDGQGYCLPAGVMVEKAYGQRLPIEDVKKGDLVLTHEGGERKVTNTFNRRYTGEMFSFTIGDTNIESTGEHPFGVLTGGKDVKWMPARDVKAAGDDNQTVLLTSRGPAFALDKRVRRVFEMPVYNIEVEETSSYWANGFAVHNCWAYSTTAAATLVRAVNNQPYVPLSAHMVGCLVKGYRNEGGWCTLSLKFISENGVASAKHWPAKSMSRSNDTPEMRANAKQHAIVEWMDLSDDQQEAKHQLATCLLLNIPVASDRNHWGHSTCDVRLMSWDPFKVMTWNSWTDSWGDRGMGIMAGGKALTNGAVAPRVVRVSPD